MKQLLVSVALAMVLGASTARAELLHVNLTVFGMD